jgi:putative restriction endonuclease
MAQRVFGHIPGYPEGSRFGSRAELSGAGVHRPTMAGIAGSERVDSIVLSGGYEDDEDLGEEIVYTGHGGRDWGSGRQVAHQQLTKGNLALARSSIYGLPVRVIRGANLDSSYAPRSGYRYDGLYLVDDYWQDIGKSGFRVWRYRLLKLPGLPTRTDAVSEAPAAYSAAQRREVTVLRLVRDTAQGRRVKALYGQRCQVCGTRLEGLADPTQRRRTFDRLGHLTTDRILRTTYSVCAPTTTCYSTTGAWLSPKILRCLARKVI